MNKNYRFSSHLKDSSGTVRNIVIGISIAMLIVGAIVGIKFLQFGAMSAASSQMMMPPSPVNAFEVYEETWPDRIGSVGTITAVQGTILSAEVEGVVRKIKFQAGAMVKAGDELVLLDIDTELAQLRSAQAVADGAQLDFDRAKELMASHAISKSDFTNINVKLKQAIAEVDNIQTIIDKKTLHAPFSGKLGIRSISEGQFLNKGDAVVSLFSLSPVYVDFSVPQQRLSELTEGLTVAISSDTYPGQQFEGQITAINPNIDLTTRNVRIQATLGNKDQRLRPGMFVTVAITLEKAERVLVIPATAVAHAAFGDAVFVIEESQSDENGNKTLALQQQIVTLGKRQGDYVVVTSGLKAGQQIVSAGVFKVWPGMSVIIDNTLAPDFQLSPKPDNT